MTDEVGNVIGEETEETEDISFELWTFFIFAPQYMGVAWSLMWQLPNVGRRDQIHGSYLQ